MWILEQPAYLLLLVFLPPLMYLRHAYRGRGARVELPFSVYGGTVYRPPVTARVVFVRVLSAAYWLAWVLLIVALAGPTKTERERVYLTRGIDIMLVVDQSPSMASQDFQPGNRFETARTVMRRFIRQRPNDHIGLVGFSSEAALRVPPTLNYEYLLSSIDAMETGELGNGTAIGMGIALATLHVQHSSAQERVIVLLTDGVNNAGEISPEAAAAVAGEAGVRIYAIGVGSKEEAPIEIRDPDTGQLFRATVRDSYDPDVLREVASLSEGSFFTAGSAGTLETIFEAIGTAENTQRRVQQRVTQRPYARVLIMWALALLVGELLVRRLFVGGAP